MRGVLVFVVLACAVLGSLGSNLELDLEDSLVAAAAPAPVTSPVTQFTSDAPVDINAHSADEIEPVMQSAPAKLRKSIAKSAMRFAQAAVKTAEELAAYGQMYIRGNGCGTDATAKYIPQGNMLPACNKHDDCYSNCHDTKVNCDNKFASDMKAICASKYAGFAKSISRGLCYVQAGIYYLAVSKLGNAAYAAGMAAHGCPGKKA